ncbi:MAG: hypothetical protein AB2421_07705 [Thermotaleaceae bacterium]
MKIRKAEEAKRLVDPGAVEDIQELQLYTEGLKSGEIAGTENQINTAGATSSTPENKGEKE